MYLINKHILSQQEVLPQRPFWEGRREGCLVSFRPYLSPLLAAKIFWFWQGELQWGAKLPDVAWKPTVSHPRRIQTDAAVAGTTSRELEIAVWTVSINFRANSWSHFQNGRITMSCCFNALWLNQFDICFPHFPLLGLHYSRSPWIPAWPHQFAYSGMLLCQGRTVRFFPNTV